MRALGRALGRCEDAQEETLYHGKFGGDLDERMAALTQMPAYGNAIARLAGVAFRYGTLLRDAAQRRNDPSTEEKLA